jgi:hypothetical protein
MTAHSIVPVVEGPGDRDALPVLLRRVLGERLQRYDVAVGRPKSANGKSKLIRKLEDFLKYASMSPGCNAILVLLDADTDCPLELAPQLARRAAGLALPVPIAIVCPKREYETWFIASLDSDSGQDIKRRLGLPSTTSYGGAIEEIPRAKAWLTSKMPQDRAYKATLDQPRLSSFVDIERTFQRSRSFRRFCSAVDQLLRSMDSGSVTVTP